MASMMANITSRPLNAIAAEHSALFDSLRDFDPIKLAATFGGLLAIPELQSNCIRLEALVHLSLAMGRGNGEPGQNLIGELFTALGNGVCGRAEDPAEDVFVSSVGTPRGNFRVLEGTWESAGFFLQRVLDAVEKMPNGTGYDDLRESIYALLRLSDVVCERGGLVRHQLGSEIPEAALPEQIAGRLASIQRLVLFSEPELETLGISIDHLAAFGFIPDEREALLDESIGHSTLERYPVLYRDGGFYLVLPSTVSATIRRFVIERMEAAGMLEAFLAGLAREYADMFSRVPLLGGHTGAQIEFRRTKAGMLAGTTLPVERGRFLNLVFFLDTLEGFEIGGLAGYNPDVTALEGDVNAWVDYAYEAARNEEGFRDGITLLVGCGVGRGVALSLEKIERPGWRFEFVSAADLCTLSWVEDFKPLSLWRLFEAEEKIQSLGVTLQNINGLLNMVAWAKSLEGHLIPHAQLPDDFMAEHGSAFIMIEQNGLRDLRHDVGTSWDPHVEQDVQGRWNKVRRDARSLFEEDRKRPLYASEEKRDSRGVPAVYVTANRPWWCEIEVSSETSGHFAFQRWKMATTWISRAAPVLDDAFADLPAGPILWRARFDGILGVLDDDSKKMGYAEAKALLSVFAEVGGQEITIVAAPEFEGAYFNEDNVAERALVEMLIEGTAMVAGRELDASERERLIASIVPDSLARQTHMFRTQSFRDYVRSSLPRSPITIDETDAATIKLGLGWSVRDKAAGSTVEGKSDCLDYLNALVRFVEGDLCNELRAFDRLRTIRLLLRNHEVTVVDRENWSRTAAAMLSLHSDKAAAMGTMASHDFKLNAVFQATRLLSEIAVCECPLSGGRVPSQSDISHLMAKIMGIQQLGGWSDAIRWDVMEPHLRIRPFGDVHAKLGFVDEIIAPFARATSDIRVTDAVENYAANLALPEFQRSVHDVFDVQFLDAWKDETGATLDELRLFVDYVEDIGIRQNEAVLTLRKSSFRDITVDGQSLPNGIASALVEFLTLRNRPIWQDVPEGFEDGDRQPWRFRRRLSVLRKPLLQIDDADDPTIVVAPGLLRDAVTYMIGNYHRGDFPLRQLKRAMRSWAGTLRDRAGREFSQEVTARLEELGWQVEPEVKITKLLRQGFDRDFGDVDVLAWNPISGRVLIIECKDVQYRKTYGEIAEQLADFRGEIWPDGKRDYLRRHLDRVDLISSHLQALAKFVGMPAVDGIESHLVFKHPVPMEFALQHMAERVSVGIFDRLERI
jgi:hypothetical protein